jgi:hypothetical protein
MSNNWKKKQKNHGANKTNCKENVEGESFLTIGLGCHHNEVCLRIGWYGDGVLDVQMVIVWNSIGESRAWGVNLEQHTANHKNTKIKGEHQPKEPCVSEQSEMGKCEQNHHLPARAIVQCRTFVAQLLQNRPSPGLQNDQLAPE